MKLETLRDQIAAGLPDRIGNLRARAVEHAPDAVASMRRGYSIVNAAEESVVRVYDEIWWLGVNAQDLVADLDAITTPKIRVEINSPGGDVFDGIAIYNALRNHPAHITTRVDGIAASIASIIAQAGDRRVMLDSAQMMIHNAWGYAVGDSREHADMAKLLDQQDQVLASIYALRAGRDDAEFRDLMNAETWLTAQAAVDAGLADEIETPAVKEDPDARTSRTFHDEIADAVDAVSGVIASAERVVALRAEAGKDLSNRNREGLAGLRDQLDELLGTPPTNQDEGDGWTDAELAAWRARNEARLSA